MEVKILSICIPTYNRAEILDRSLKNLFDNQEVDFDEIEVIVSDNCSTDNTKAIVAKYPMAIYHRNTQNEKFYNLTTVLNYGKGKYLKLVNDTFRFKPNALKKIISIIRDHDERDINLLFFPNFLNNKCKDKRINSFDSFLMQCSYYSTWTASVGFWKKDFDLIENKNKYAQKHLPQLEWVYRIVKNGKSTVIYFDDFFEMEIPNNKGGYNIFQTFITDYLDIVKNEKPKFIVYEFEKYRLFRYFVYPWLRKLLVNEKPQFSFDTNDALKILLKKYWYEIYIYPMLVDFWLRKIKNSFGVY